MKSPIRGIRIGVLRVLNSILELNSDQSVVIPILDFLRSGPLEDERGQSIWTRENEIAISILGKVRDRRSVPVLIDIMKNYPSYRSDVVTEVLVLIGDKSAIPGLIEVLRLEYDANWSVIARLIKALGRLKAKEAVDVIVNSSRVSSFSWRPGVRSGAGSGDPRAT